MFYQWKEVSQMRTQCACLVNYKFLRSSSSGLCAGISIPFMTIFDNLKLLDVHTLLLKTDNITINLITRTNIFLNKGTMKRRLRVRRESVWLKGNWFSILTAWNTTGLRSLLCKLPHEQYCTALRWRFSEEVILPTEPKHLLFSCSISPQIPQKCQLSVSRVSKNLSHAGCVYWGQKIVSRY